MSDVPTFYSPETLFRFRIVSVVDALVIQGHGAEAAVRLAAAGAADMGAESRSVGVRTVQRWRSAYRREGIAGLEPRLREALSGSLVLPDGFVEFLRSARRDDLKASVPELIRLARATGVIGSETPVDRSTVWRVMRRMGLDTSRSRRAPKDTRRFAYRERMQLVMADFKHFRAGPTRRKRLAIYLLDDATRFGLDVLVTTDGEDAETVLIALERVLRKWGRFSILYVDRGPGFKADDIAQVMAKLDIALLLGTAKYPEGRGKIERFNRSTKARILRALTCEDVDPEPESLTLRLRHDLHQVYNHLPHDSLADDTPSERWQGGRELRPIDDDTLRDAFVLGVERTVGNDHVVSVDGVAYEMPRGFARERVVLQRHLLDDGSLHHPDTQGRLIRLCPVDVHANATSGRASDAVEPTPDAPPGIKTASMIRFEQTHGSILGPDGGFTDPESTEDP